MNVTKEMVDAYDSAYNANWEAQIRNPHSDQQGTFYAIEAGLKAALAAKDAAPADDFLSFVCDLAGIGRRVDAAPAPSEADGAVPAFWCDKEMSRAITNDLKQHLSSLATIGFTEPLYTRPQTEPAPAVGGVDQRFTELLLSVINDVQNELGFSDEDKECSNGSAEIVDAIRELKEDAEIGAKWREDSSLEKWFPFTAEELSKLKSTPPAPQGDARDAERPHGNLGHGHVYPRPDGRLAKCGGPGVCAECSKDAAIAAQAGKDGGA